jgi:hypothetical protein
VDWLAALVQSIVQAAGTDAYNRASALLGQVLGRFGNRKTIEARFKETRKQLQTDSDRLGAESAMWALLLQDLLAQNPSAEAELRSLTSRIAAISPRQAPQIGIAGRDQYMAGGNIYIHPPRD